MKVGWKSTFALKVFPEALLLPVNELAPPPTFPPMLIAPPLEAFGVILVYGVF